MRIISFCNAFVYSVLCVICRCLLRCRQFGYAVCRLGAYLSCVLYDHMRGWLELWFVYKFGLYMPLRLQWVVFPSYFYPGVFWLSTGLFFSCGICVELYTLRVYPYLWVQVLCDDWSGQRVRSWRKQPSQHQRAR